MLKAVPGGNQRNRSADKRGKQKTEEDARQEKWERAERLEKEYAAELIGWQEIYRRDQEELFETREESEERADKILKLTSKLEELQFRHDKYQRNTKEFEDEMQRQITRLTIDRHELATTVAEFDKVKEGLEKKVVELTAQLQASEARVRDAEVVRRGIEHDASVMEQNLKGALNMARRENLALRMTHRGQAQELQSRLEDVQGDLGDLLNRVESAVVPLQTRTAAVEMLEAGLDYLRIRYQDIVQQCRLKVSRFSTELVKVSSLHSNVPDYVKESLEKQSETQLRNLVNTLAFDESVRQYLEVLFPPPWESEFRCPDTPSAALASSDLFVAGKRQVEERPSSAPASRKSTTNYPAVKALTRPQTAARKSSKPLIPLHGEATSVENYRVYASEKEPLPPLSARSRGEKTN